MEEEEERKENRKGRESYNSKEIVMYLLYICTLSGIEFSLSTF